MSNFQPEFYNVSEIALSYKSNIVAAERPVITTAADSYHIFRQAWDDNLLDFIEQAKLLLLNRANRVLGICNLSSGNVSGTIVDPKMVFAAALKANATQLILAHNHPSENLAPSNADRTITDKLRRGSEYLDLTFLDHLIITRRGYYAFSTEEMYLMPQENRRNPASAPELF